MVTTQLVNVKIRPGRSGVFFERIEGLIEPPLNISRKELKALPRYGFREDESVHSVLGCKPVGSAKLVERFSGKKKRLLKVAPEVIRRDFIHEILDSLGGALAANLVIAKPVAHLSGQGHCREFSARTRHH